MISPDTLTALETLEQRATPGPWKHCPTPMNITDANAVEVADCSYHLNDGGTEAQATANAALILAVHNSLPDLLAAARLALQVQALPCRRMRDGRLEECTLAELLADADQFALFSDTLAAMIALLAQPLRELLALIDAGTEGR